MGKKETGIAIKSSEFKFQHHYFWPFPTQTMENNTLLEDSNEMMKVPYKLERTIAASQCCCDHPIKRYTSSVFRINLRYTKRSNRTVIIKIREMKFVYVHESS